MEVILLPDVSIIQALPPVSLTASDNKANVYGQELRQKMELF